jgi:hypothetical protein
MDRFGYTFSFGCFKNICGILILKEYKEDLTGRVFGDLVVLSFSGRRKINRGNQTTPVWTCICKCGITREVVESRLKNGRVSSCKPCGLKRIRVANSEGRTGIPVRVSSERLHGIWSAMKQRCSNPNNISYPNYGAKGVTVCDDWKNSYKSFRDWALSNGYQEDLTIDRKVHTLGYNPDNCRWVTLSENDSEMCKRHKEQGTGGFSEESFAKIRATNKSKLGCKFSMYLDGELLSDWECLIDCAEHICKIKGLKTDPVQIKKNISACLNGKRGKCHGFTFKFKN